MGLYVGSTNIKLNTTTETPKLLIKPSGEIINFLNGTPTASGSIRFVGKYPALTIQDEASYNHIGTDNFGNLGFYISSPNSNLNSNIETAKLSILATSGNVGIGTKTPKSKLAVVGLQVFTDNTAALAGTLTAGDFYRKADGTLMVVF